MFMRYNMMLYNIFLISTNIFQGLIKTIYLKILEEMTIYLLILDQNQLESKKFKNRPSKSLTILLSGSLNS